MSAIPTRLSSSKPARPIKLPRTASTWVVNTMLAIALTIAALPLVRWGLFQAVWSGDAAACGTDGAGACWAFLGAKLRFILFGFFQPEQQWRPGLVIVLLLSLLVVSAIPRFWSRRVICAWLIALFAIPLLMAGGGLLPAVSTHDWGGLPLTLMVSIAGVILAFPLAVAMALARQSNMRILRWLSIAYIETLRAVPMIVVLYMATLITPMALPAGFLVDKLLRAQIGITIFASAYLAEVVRAGLQTIGKGQVDAGTSLGLTAWQTQRLIVLPQALRAVIPAIVNLSIGIMLNTSLLAVIGLFDLLNTAKASAADTHWLGFYTEAYLLVAVLYFALSYSVSRYSLWLERYLRSAPR